MLKNLTQLELLIEGKIYHFNCDPNSPISHVKEALVKFLQFAGQIEDQIAAQKKEQEEKAAAEAPPPAEEPPKE